MIEFAIWDVNISIGFSIGELTKCTNNKCVSVIHIGAFGLKISDKFSSFVVDGNLAVDIAIVSKNKFEC